MCLIIESIAVKVQTPAEWMKDYKNIDEPFPDVDADPLPLE